MTVGPLTPGSISFTVPNPPVAKARPRVTGAGSYTPAKTRAYEKIVAGWAKIAMIGKPVMTESLRVIVTFHVPRPARCKRRLPSVRPDLDNYVKSLLDGCQKGGIFHDDGQICVVHAAKVYGDPPRTVVFIDEIPEDVPVTEMDREGTAA